MSQPTTIQIYECPLSDADILEHIFECDGKNPKPIDEDLVQKIADKFNELCSLLTQNNIAIVEIDNQEKFLHIQKLSRRNFKRYSDMGNYDFKRGSYTVNDVNSIL